MRGISEIAGCVTYVDILTGIIGVVIAGALAYFVSKLSLSLFKNNKFIYFAYYGFALGALCLIIGIVEIIISR